MTKVAVVMTGCEDNPMNIPSRQQLMIAFTFAIGWMNVCEVGFPARGDQPVENSQEAASARDFDQTTAPILIRNCLECHHGSEPSGGLDLSSADSFAEGGESGALFDAVEPATSLLWQKISSGEMPPESRLSETEKDRLLRWVEAGSPWSNRTLDPYELTTSKRGGYDWWSLQPIVDPPIPHVASEVANPIDAFVLKRLSQAGLAMSPRADAKTLVRRLITKLHGIHPDAETVQWLEANDTAESFDALIAEALESHRYGERWARHWLDVARFGESQGFERDKSRPNAWRYRDWVINALNRDLPYDQFAKLQIAGDCMPEAGRDGVIASGFLVAGAWDEVGQNQQSAAMKNVVRQDELEDYVGTVGQTFLGLTTNCARCHDHKFDPIRQSEYYALCSALDGVHHGERDITPPEVIAAAKEKQASKNEQLRSLEAQLANLEEPVFDAITEKSTQLPGEDKSAERFVRQPLAHWDFASGLQDQFGIMHADLRDGAELDGGAVVLDGKKAHVATAPIGVDIVEKTLAVRVTLSDLDQRGGGAMTLLSTKVGQFDSVVFGEREPKRWLAGSENFARTMNVGGPDETDAVNQPVHLAITYAGDGAIRIYRDGQLYGSPYQASSLPLYKKKESVVAFGIRHFPLGGNRMLAGRIHQASLYDRVLSDNEVQLLAGGASFISDEVMAQYMKPEQLGEWTALRSEIKMLREIDTSVPRELTYAVMPTQPKQPTRVLLRGNPATPDQIVSAQGIASIKGTNWSFDLPADAPQADRRRKLADWIASRDNPLFARVIVNRLWHHHFGVGLVTTPNDFGFSGGQPSHPELLDYLASRLIESNWSLKSIHRLILNSATWQQATIPNETSESIDAGNRLLWRGNRTRLDAETLRDSILLAAGQLNDQVGGPSYQDFNTFNFNSQFYDMIDPVGEAFNRRTIYRMLIRSGRNRMLDAFDCPDPSSTAPKRTVTTTPIQSLSLMNHSFVLRMADHFADRIVRDVGNDPDAQVNRAVQIAWCRGPTATESELFVRFTEKHGLPALCRVLFNSNEFLYVD